MLKRAVWMSDRGHQVHFFCVSDTPLHREVVKSELALSLISRNPKSLALKSGWKLSRRFKALNIELAWCSDKRDISVLGVAKSNCKGKLKLLYQQQMTMGVPKRDFYHTLIFKKIDFWIAPLNYLKRQVGAMTKFPIERVHVVPLAMDVQKFLTELPDRSKARAYFNLDEKDLVVGMIGRIDFAKSQQFVKSVISEMIDERSELKMLMVGNKTEGEWDDYYKVLVKDLEENHSSGDIQLYPFMSEVGYFYQAIDIFVMASKNETYGMVTVEAMLAEKIIAGTKSAGTEELLNQGKHGYYFNWMDAQSLKRALNEILADPEKARQKAVEAKKYAVNQMSHHEELRQVEDIIHNYRS